MSGAERHLTAQRGWLVLKVGIKLTPPSVTVHIPNVNLV